MKTEHSLTGAALTRWVGAVSRLLAVLGGLVLLLLIGLTCASVAGRGLNSLGHTQALSETLPALAAVLTQFGPIQGDFELVEAGVAFAIFAFLPLCQLQGGHAVVDIFTTQLPGRANRFLTAFWEVVLAAVILLIAWRLFVGMQSKMTYGETTFLLQFPVWWAYAASFLAAAIAAIVAVYCACARVVGELTGRPCLPSSKGDHP